MKHSPFRDFAYLARDYVPKFPDKCVGCCSPGPAHRVTLWTMSSSWWSWLIPIIALFTTRAAKVTFPACRRCAWRMRFRRLSSFAVMIVPMVVLGFFVFKWSEGWPRIARRLSILGVIVVGAIPWVCSEVWFPQAVDLTLEDHVLKYEFRDIEFASEFRMLNMDALRK